MRASGLNPTPRLELDLAPDAVVGRGLALDTSTTAAGEIVHGTRLRCGDVELQLVDRAVLDATTPAKTRSRLLSHVSRATGEVQSFVVVNKPITLVGSLDACDLIVSGIAPIAAAVWMRADGELELVEIDESVLPYGQPVTGARLWEPGALHHVGGEAALQLRVASALT